ncbi:MAG: hypothetical protein FJ087_22275 [Deltaproteobacteria bacterium]|nr:hypothetical protein [Deltaproteobacteria bacterium]
METTKTIPEVVAVLRKDLEAARKSRLYTLIGGAVVALILFVVFWNLTSQIKENFKPETIASVAAHATRQAVKDGRPVVEKAFVEGMPKFLKGLRQSLLHELVPQLRKQLEGELSRVVAKSFENSSRAFGAAVKDAIKQVKEAAPAGKPDPDFLSQVIAREFAKETDKRYSQTPEQTLGQEFRDSRKALDMLNARLSLLAGGKPANREEALELRFLRAWVSLINRGEPDGSQPLAPDSQLK